MGLTRPHETGDMRADLRAGINRGPGNIRADLRASINIGLVMSELTIEPVSTEAWKHKRLSQYQHRPGDMRADLRASINRGPGDMRADLRASIEQAQRTLFFQRHG